MLGQPKLWLGIIKLHMMENLIRHGGWPHEKFDEEATPLGRPPAFTPSTGCSTAEICMSK